MDCNKVTIGLQTNHKLIYNPLGYHEIEHHQWSMQSNPPTRLIARVAATPNGAVFLRVRGAFVILSCVGCVPHALFTKVAPKKGPPERFEHFHSCSLFLCVESLLKKKKTRRRSTFNDLLAPSEHTKHQGSFVSQICPGL